MKDYIRSIAVFIAKRQRFFIKLVALGIRRVCEAKFERWQSQSEGPGPEFADRDGGLPPERERPFVPSFPRHLAKVEL